MNKLSRTIHQGCSTTRQALSPSIRPAGDLGVNDRSFGRHLRAENRSPRTQETYGEAARQFAQFLADQGMPRDVAQIKREHIEAFVERLLETRKASTASNRYLGLQAFFKWAVEDGELRESPMERMPPPPKIEAHAAKCFPNLFLKEPSAALSHENRVTPMFR